MRTEKAYHVSIPNYAVIDMEENNHATTARRKEKDYIEVYAMAIQKTRRGFWSGQTNKKKSYKLCDTGFLVLYPDGRVDGALFE